MGITIGITTHSSDKAEPYRTALREIGIAYVEITPGDPRSLEGLGGLLVTGGGADVNPALYGQDPHPQTDGPPDEKRDTMESRLLTEALDADLPILCICRGMQMFNIVHGGTLNQHIPQAALHCAKPPPSKRHEIVHPVNLVAGTKMAGILGVSEHPVNSRHHQAVDRVGQGLILSARAPDGVIEALERPDKSFAIACQWHPEESIRTNPGDRKIFEAFAAAL